MATFGGYLISLSATLSSWFLRFVWASGRWTGVTKNPHLAIGDVEDAPEAGRDVGSRSSENYNCSLRGAVFDLREVCARGQRGCDERVSRERLGESISRRAPTDCLGNLSSMLGTPGTGLTPL